MQLYCSTCLMKIHRSSMPLRFSSSSHTSLTIIVFRARTMYFEATPTVWTSYAGIPPTPTWLPRQRVTRRSESGTHAHVNPSQRSPQKVGEISLLTTCNFADRPAEWQPGKLLVSMTQQKQTFPLICPVTRVVVLE